MCDTNIVYLLPYECTDSGLVFYRYCIDCIFEYYKDQLPVSFLECVAIVKTYEPVCLCGEF